MSSIEAKFRIAGRDEARDAVLLLTEFLETDEYYLDSSSRYSMGGHRAQEAVGLLIDHPENGVIVLGYIGATPVSCCVLTFAVSTSAGSWVTKLDDMYVLPGLRGKGIGTAMMKFVVELVSSRGHRRIDLGVHIRNVRARRFYKRVGFRSLHEERQSLLLSDRVPGRPATSP